VACLIPDTLSTSRRRSTGKANPRSPIIKPAALREAEEFTAGHEPEEPETVRKFDRVIQLIEGFESPYGLDSITRAVYELSERKRQIMKPEHIRIAWERLQEKGWLE
jgi:hypothetical protein